VEQRLASHQRSNPEVTERNCKAVRRIWKVSIREASSKGDAVARRQSRSEVGLSLRGDSTTY
jgi:hypothetical protein